MSTDLREQACWLLLTFESGLSNSEINGIIEIWCRKQQKTLEEFFAASTQEWKKLGSLSIEAMKKLEQAKAKLIGQSFLLEQMSHKSIYLLTELDDDYPKLLQSTLKPNQLPPVLCYAGDLKILEHRTIAIIGSRNAGEESLNFTRQVAQYLAKKGANVISGNARGVDRTAYEGAVGGDGYTTVVLPHGIRKISGVQMRDLQPKIASGKVLLLSQFHPDAQWTVGRAMERNKIVTALAKIVIVAESDVHGGTWDGANVALSQKRPLYVCQSKTFSTLPGNSVLIKNGGYPIPWPAENLADVLVQVLDGDLLKVREQIQVEESPLVSQLQLNQSLEIDQQEQAQERFAVGQEQALEVNKEQVDKPRKRRSTSSSSSSGKKKATSSKKGKSTSSKKNLPAKATNDGLEQLSFIRTSDSI